MYYKQKLRLKKEVKREFTQILMIAYELDKRYKIKRLRPIIDRLELMEQRIMRYIQNEC
jgi:hypothetical protein